MYAASRLLSSTWDGSGPGGCESAVLGSDPRISPRGTEGLQTRRWREPEAQTRKVMDNLKRALAGTGAGFEDIVCARIFLTNFERDYAAFNRLYTEYFRPDRLPARTTVGVTHLARGSIVEIDLIARRS